MYPNLEAEVARVRMSKRQLAKKLGKAPATMSQKFAGKVGIDINEAFEIKKIIGCENVSIDELFAWKD